MILTTCRPQSDLVSFFRNNILVKQAINNGIAVCLYNQVDELPDEIFGIPDVSVVTDYQGKRPSLNAMLQKTESEHFIYANSDIELDMKQVKETFTFFKSSNYDLGAARRRDYQWNKSHYKIQSYETLDIFFIKVNTLKAILNTDLIPGTIKFDNLLIDLFLLGGKKVMDLTKVVMVYHRNHEQFKINGYFNLILNNTEQSSFQVIRNDTSKKIKFGSLAYGDQLIQVNGTYRTKRRSKLSKRFRYYWGRFKVKLYNKLEKLLSILIWKFYDSRQVIEDNYRYFGLIYIPKSK